MNFIFDLVSKAVLWSDPDQTKTPLPPQMADVLLESCQIICGNGISLCCEIWQEGGVRAGAGPHSSITCSVGGNQIHGLALVVPLNIGLS